MGRILGLPVRVQESSHRTDDLEAGVTADGDQDERKTDQVAEGRVFRADEQRDGRGRKEIDDVRERAEMSAELPGSAIVDPVAQNDPLTRLADDLPSHDESR